MRDRAKEDLRRLARLDEELAARVAGLRRLDEAAGLLRGRAEAIDAFFAGYPAEEAKRAAALERVAEELEQRRAQLAEAETTLERAKDDEARASGERAVARARDHVDLSAAKLERAEAERARLEEDASALAAEVAQLDERAKELARELTDLPAPAGGPAGLVEWASRAHAELFVAARQLDAQRELVIREANELASMLVGEPTYGSTVAQALARVEGHWVSSPGQVSESR